MIALIDKYFPDLTRPQRGQFEALYALYADWNTKINVISRKDFDQLYLRHVLHSLSIAKVCPFAPGARVLDVGCGGGFPSVPLAILFPEAHFTAVDSIGKKIKVVQGVAEGLGLANSPPATTVMSARIPTIFQPHPPLRPGRNASRTVRLCGFPRRDGDADLRRLGLG